MQAAGPQTMPSTGQRSGQGQPAARPCSQYSSLMLPLSEAGYTNSWVSPCHIKPSNGAFSQLSKWKAFQLGYFFSSPGLVVHLRNKTSCDPDRMEQIGSKDMCLSGWKSPTYLDTAAFSLGFKAEVSQLQEYQLPLGPLSSRMGRGHGVVIAGTLANHIWWKGNLLPLPVKKGRQLNTVIRGMCTPEAAHHFRS